MEKLSWQHCAQVTLSVEELLVNEDLSTIRKILLYHWSLAPEHGSPGVETNGTLEVEERPLGTEFPIS